MSKKRQAAVLDPRGHVAAQLTTLSYDYVDGHVVPAHFHREHQLVFGVHGVMTIRTGKGMWVVPPLRAVWIPAGEVHSIAMTGAVRMRTLYFAAGAARAIERRCFVLNVSPLLRELILHACRQPAWSARIAMEQRVIAMALDQLRQAKIVPLQLPQPQDARALRVVDELVRHPGDPRPLEALCKSAGASKRTVERAFIDGTGMSFGKWRQQLRLLHAMRRLSAGEKVLAAALDAGYRSPSAFIAVFRKSFGQTPNRYFESDAGAAE